MPDDDALSTVQDYHRAWTRGDVERAMAYVSDDVRCYAPDENVTTKSDWQEHLARFEIRLVFDRLGYLPPGQQPT
jgi:ketosteroid isomerase-like protein